MSRLGKCRSVWRLWQPVHIVQQTDAPWDTTDHSNIIDLRHGAALPPSSHKPSSYDSVDGFQSLNIAWQALSLLLGVWLPLCICMWKLPVSVAFNETTSLLSKMFRIKKLCKYARAGARLAASVWLSCFICCDSYSSLVSLKGGHWLPVEASLT